LDYTKASVSAFESKMPYICFPKSYITSPPFISPTRIYTSKNTLILANVIWYTILSTNALHIHYFCLITKIICPWKHSRLITKHFCFNIMYTGRGCGWRMIMLFWKANHIYLFIHSGIWLRSDILCISAFYSITGTFRII